MSGFKLAFVSGLSDKKLGQKLVPLQKMNGVAKIYLYRRRPYYGEKVCWMKMPYVCSRSAILGDLWRFAVLLKNSRHYDIIIGCSQTYHGAIAYICGNVWKKPVIQVIITDIDRIYKRWLLKKAMFSASACLVRGPISYDRLLELGYKGRIEILHNHFYISGTKKNKLVHDKRYDLLAVGSYVDEKDYPWMMHVLARVKEKFPRLKAAIVGGGAFKKNLRAILQDKKLYQNIDFLGWKDEKGLEEIYQNSKALLLTSKFEGLPMVVVEAMSHNLPVFVTSVGDLPWLVKDGVEGRIVSHGDTQKMSAVISEALLDVQSLEKMGSLAYMRIESLLPEFDSETVSGIWLKMCNSVAQKGCN